MAASVKHLHSMNLRGVVISALLVFVAVAWWAKQDADDPAVSAKPAEASTSPANSEWPQLARRGSPGSAQVEPTPQTQGAAEASFGAYVNGKYRFLFDADLPAEAAEKLRAALLERERIAVAINTARQSSDADAKEAIPRQLAELANLDQKIGGLLRPGDLATFDALKDSDIEQFQLDDYAGGINAVAPLDEADKKAILYTKLAHRQRFRQVLADSGLMRGDLDAAERRRAFAEVSRALGESKDHYLQEVRQYLYNDEQFSLLSNYENTEYTAELEKLRGIAYAE
ncbi:MAG TPA: hypothetical protein VGO61_18780 [Steroidobacteraceae bacterium]|jgi:hypothetical protein|nr:hypothetical protein [Steroidobacteraceae bacterium]